MEYYAQPHVTQYDGGPKQNQACVPASLANGVAASTGGARKPSSRAIHALVPTSQESNPKTPGWSMADADKAMGKIGVAYTPHEGWDALEKAHDDGHYVVVQGDSDIFSNSTCSGAFNGDHCIGASPNDKVVDGVEYWWIDDPICKTARWEKKSTIKAYAHKFSSAIHWGKFETLVPKTVTPKPPAKPVVTLKYGGKALKGTKRIAVPAGRKANVRTRPSTTAKLAPTRSGGSLNGGPNRLANRHIVTFSQRTTTGAKPAGSSSRTWYGDKTGTRWVHSTAF